jgi:hypothetical protein
MYSLFLYIFALHVSGAICSHPQDHKLQSTVLGVCNCCGMLAHWSRYWLGHPHTFFSYSPLTHNSNIVRMFINQTVHTTVRVMFQAYTICPFISNHVCYLEL